VKPEENHSDQSLFREGSDLAEVEIKRQDDALFANRFVEDLPVG
jgi:hypothetical protein